MLFAITEALSSIRDFMEQGGNVLWLIAILVFFMCPKLFVGPGEKLVLRTWECDAIWVWRKFIDDSGQEGINCAIFRNESSHRSSDLVRQADRIADHCWPGARHYTYVDAEKITSVNPGFCFKAAAHTPQYAL